MEWGWKILEREDWKEGREWNFGLDINAKKKKEMNGKEKTIKSKTFTSVNIKMFH